MNLKLFVWRQEGPNAAGKMVSYDAKGITEHQSFLEMLDTVNETLIAEGKEHIRTVLSKQGAKGAFVEAGGQDSSYQAVSLWRLSEYLLYSRDAKLNARVRDALALGWEWEKSRITGEGEVMTAGNARTGPQGEVWRGRVKQVNYPEVCMALVFWSYIGHDDAVRELAEKVRKFGYRLYRQRRR